METGNGVLTYELLYQGQYLSGFPSWVLVYGELSITYEQAVAFAPSLGAADAGLFYTETSRSSITSYPSLPRYRWSGAAWVLQSGRLYRLQSEIAALVALLGSNDYGLELYVEDFAHMLFWEGTTFVFGVGEDGANPIVGLPAAPAIATAWQLCDGTATTFLNGDGTTSAFTTQNLTGQYLKFNNAGYTGTKAAGGDTGAPTATTLILSAGAVSVPTAAAVYPPGTIDLARTELLPYFRR